MNILENIADTIAAVATPRGRGGIGIIRISGSRVKNILFSVTRKRLTPRYVYNVNLYDEEDKLLDRGIAIFFKAPRSFTGENVIEFHIHGNDLILDSVLLRVIKLGARLAERGEFLFRAFINKKIDLLQVEAINGLVNSVNFHQNRFILDSMSGSLSLKVEELRSKLTNLRILIEGYIDFPSDLIFESSYFANVFQEFKTDFTIFFSKLNFDSYDENEKKIVILGNTNVGKSSLFNLLAKKDRALVSDMEGTTRDFIEEYINFNGLKYQLVDTAGFNNKTESFVETLSIKKTYEQIKKAFFLLLMFDCTVFKQDELDLFIKSFIKKYNVKKTIIVLVNKIDLLNLTECIIYKKQYSIVFISVKTGCGINFLKTELSLKLKHAKKSYYWVSSRQYMIILDIYKILKSLYINDGFIDLFADKLKLIDKYFDILLGNNISKGLVNDIFKNFCIGK